MVIYVTRVITFEFHGKIMRERDEMCAGRKLKTDGLGE